MVKLLVHEPLLIVRSNNYKLAIQVCFVTL
jgi:hypothetical protein